MVIFNSYVSLPEGNHYKPEVHDIQGTKKLMELLTDQSIMEPPFLSVFGESGSGDVFPNGMEMMRQLVGGDLTILKNMTVNGKDDIPYVMENEIHV